MSHIPPLVQAAIAVVLAGVGIAAFIGCWLAWESPVQRHACGMCDPLSCERCIRERRDGRVDEMAREAERGR